MTSITGAQAEALADVTGDRRAARYVEIVRWGEAVESGVWVGKGYRSPSAWMAAATGEPVGACKRMLSLGERLGRMPEMAAMFRDGVVSEQAVAAVADVWHESIAVAFERDELLFADWFYRRPFREAKMQLDAWAAIEHAAALDETAQSSFEARHFSVIKTSVGPSKISGALDNEGTAHLRAALSMLAGDVGDGRSRGQRNADALVTMAKFTLAHFEQPVDTPRRPQPVDVVINHDTLTDGTGVSWLDSEIVTPATALRLVCDAGVHRTITYGGSAILDYGRRTRTVSESLRRALVSRDGGCRFSGCGTPAAMCDAHHAEHWADGGTTSIDNLVLLCWFHHRYLHEQHWQLEPFGAGHFVLYNHQGEYQDFSTPRLDIITKQHQLTLA